MSKTDLLKWNSPADVSVQSWDRMESKLRNLLKADTIVYTLDYTKIMAKMVIMPMEFQEVDPATFNGYTADRKKVYLESKKEHDSSHRWALARNEQVICDCEKALSIVEALFDPSVNVYKAIVHIQENIDDSFMKIGAVWKLLKTKYKPNKSRNYAAQLKIWYAMDDKDKPFAVFHADFLRLVEQFEDMGRPLSEIDIEHHLLLSVTNPNFVAQTQKLMHDMELWARDHNRVRTFTWREFLQSIEDMIITKPDWDYVKSGVVDKVTAAAASLEGHMDKKSSSSTCGKCARPGHRAKQCFSKSCGNCGEPLAKDIYHDSTSCGTGGKRKVTWSYDGAGVRGDRKKKRKGGPGAAGASGSATLSGGGAGGGGDSHADIIGKMSVNDQRNMQKALALSIATAKDAVLKAGGKWAKKSKA